MTDTPGARARLKAKLPTIVAIFAALVAAYGMNEYLRDSGRAGSQSRAFNGPVVGELQSIEGQVLVRPPRGTRYEPATMGPLRAESVVQTQAASAAVIEFRPGPTLRLLENSRIVAQIDTSRDGAIQATVLAGEVTVLNAGTNPLFVLLHQGQEINFRDGSTPMPRMVPLIQIGESSEPGAESGKDQQEGQDLQEKLEIEQESELATVPAVDLDALEAADPRQKTLPKKKQMGLLGSTLTNDDIRTQVRSQAGSFQKCYVTMVNRMSEAGARVGALPRGEITVSFKILSTGKTEASRVLKSPFKDPTFDRCITQALERLRFRQFQGPTIPIAEFPIALE